MSDISNSEYITINKYGIFVGGKPATIYREKKIGTPNLIKEFFDGIQLSNPEIEELHVGAFKTSGRYAKLGNPDGKFGPNAWCRVKLIDGRLGPWVFAYMNSSDSNCAERCAFNCSSSVHYNSDLRSAVLDFTTTVKADTKKYAPESELKQILQKGDLSKFVGKKIELNGYVLTVQKQR